MSRIRGRDTKMEVLLRKELWKRGFRYRKHPKDVPGRPDIVLPKYRAAIFFNGCFWHGHDCPLFRMPGTRRDFWEAKISRNRERDAEVRRQLEAEGWRWCVVWECALRGMAKRPLDTVIDELGQWVKGSEPSCEIAGQGHRDDAEART